MDEELCARIMELFAQKKNKMMTMRDIARDLNVDHKAAKQALNALIDQGELEFTSFGGATFIQPVAK